jgi:hypothetical protein
MAGLPARSALVRATFRTRAWARAEKPRRCVAPRSISMPSGGGAAKVSMGASSDPSLHVYLS